MKLLLIVYSGPDTNRIPLLLEQHHVDGWTELDHAHGAGSTGRREGTRAWPGESALFFTAIDDERVDELKRALRDEQDGLEQGERMHVLTLPVEDFF